MYDTAEEPERVILVKAADKNEDDRTIRSLLDELKALAETAGAVKAGELVQKRERKDPGTYIGSGKLEELKNTVKLTEADSVICDDELSPAQMKNLSRETGVKVIDRTVLILDIFAQHAVTAEGKLQVELAQASYNLSHLTGSYERMSRLGGGIGTRGPGEQKIETDRRVIRNRINSVKKELSGIERTRMSMRKKRLAGSIPSIAITGYTNAGKSTLLNKLTDAGVLSEDKLFATLDTTTRKYVCEDGEELLFTDTVGFVRKLPHNLIEAFRSTLMEAGFSDLILVVADASSPDMDEQMKTVFRTLGELDINTADCVIALNKTDLLTDEQKENVRIPEEIRRILPDKSRIVRISARTGKGLEELVGQIRDVFKNRMARIDRVFSYDEAGKIAVIREKGHVISEEYVPEGIKVKGEVPKEFEYMFTDHLDKK